MRKALESLLLWLPAVLRAMSITSSISNDEDDEESDTTLVAKRARETKSVQSISFASSLLKVCFPFLFLFTRQLGRNKETNSNTIGPTATNVTQGTATLTIRSLTLGSPSARLWIRSC